MVKKILLGLLFAILASIALIASVIFKPEINNAPLVEPLSLNEAKELLNKTTNDQSEWNEQKIVKTKKIIESFNPDQTLYLATQLHVIKQEVFADQIQKLKAQTTKENIAQNFNDFFDYGVIPPLDKSDRLYPGVRTEIVNFIESQPNKEVLMPVAIGAQKVLTDGEWQPALTALKSCKDWQCKLVLDMTFNTKERLLVSIRAMKAGVYE